MQFIWPRNSGEFPIRLQVQHNFIAVSGITPTVELYRETDDFIADWSTNMFVAPSGVASGMGAMTEVPSDNGFYRRLFNPSVFGESLLEQTYYLRFKATIPSGFNSEVTADISLVEHASLKFIDFVSGSGTSSVQGMSLSFTCP